MPMAFTADSTADDTAEVPPRIRTCWIPRVFNVAAAWGVRV